MWIELKEKWMYGVDQELANLGDRGGWLHIESRCIGIAWAPGTTDDVCAIFLVVEGIVS